MTVEHREVARRELLLIARGIAYRSIFLDAAEA